MTLLSGYEFVKERRRRLELWNNKKTIRENSKKLDISYNSAQNFARKENLKYKYETN